MSRLIFDDDCVYWDTPILNGVGDVVGYKRQCPMTKEVFIECYKKWILEENEENKGE